MPRFNFSPEAKAFLLGSRPPPVRACSLRQPVNLTTLQKIEAEMTATRRAGESITIMPLMGEGGTQSLPRLQEWSTLLHQPPHPASMHVLSLANIYGLNLFDSNPRRMFHVKDTPVPVPRECSNLWQPAPAVMRFIRGLQEEGMGGRPYLSVHMRR